MSPKKSPDIETHRVSEVQAEHLKVLKERRDNEQVEKCLKAIRTQPRGARTR